MRNFQMSYWPGGLSTQPAILVMELNECIKAEREDQRIEVINQQLALKHAVKSAGKPPTP